MLCSKKEMIKCGAHQARDSRVIWQSRRSLRSPLAFSSLSANNTLDKQHAISQLYINQGSHIPDSYENQHSESGDTPYTLAGSSAIPYSRSDFLQISTSVSKETDNSLSLPPYNDIWGDNTRDAHRGLEESDPRSQAPYIPGASLINAVSAYQTPSNRSQDSTSATNKEDLPAHIR